MLSPEPPVCTFGEIKGGTKSKSADSLGCQVAESGRRLVVFSGGEAAVAAGLLVWDQRWGKNWVWTLSDADSRTSAEGRSQVPERREQQEVKKEKKFLVTFGTCATVTFPSDQSMPQKEWLSLTFGRGREKDSSALR